MNSGVWITFLLSSGCGDRPAGWRGAMPPPSRFAAGASDDATEHLPK
jgi:hypothetical protein